ncbi:hypothetical protein EON83_13055 [bacterium]|nr:MAG: hypothetical protein EON83_13055 [bacterium]
MQNLLNSSCYCSTVRVAQGLADILKRTRPHLTPQVEELQASVTQAHAKLHKLSQISHAGAVLSDHEGQKIVRNPARFLEARAALAELGTAYQSLRDLKRAGKTTA